jgi:hypothetical protein
MRNEHLKTYLNDHLAGAKMGLQLVRDCQAHNPEEPLSTFLQQLAEEIDEDHDVLIDLYARLPGRENVLKKATAWLASKASRLKLESILLQYSDLTRLEELEGLLLGVRGKLALWEAFDTACVSDERFSDVDFRRLQQRARRQHDQIEEHRLRAARKAFES